MDFDVKFDHLDHLDHLAQQWDKTDPLTVPTIVSALLGYDSRQLTALRVSVGRYPRLAHAVQVIDNLSAFREAKQQLDAAREAARRVAEHAQGLAGAVAAAPAVARESVERAATAQVAAAHALNRASSPRDKVEAAVVLELAETAAKQALEVASAADRLTASMEALLRAMQSPALPDGLGNAPDPAPDSALGSAPPMRLIDGMDVAGDPKNLQ